MDAEGPDLANDPPMGEFGAYLGQAVGDWTGERFLGERGERFACETSGDGDRFAGAPFHADPGAGDTSEARS